MAEPLASDAFPFDTGDASVAGQAVFCSCGAPGRIDYAWNGNGYVVCDGYTPCGRDLEAVSFGYAAMIADEIVAADCYANDLAGQISVGQDDLEKLQAERDDLARRIEEEKRDHARELAALERELTRVKEEIADAVDEIDKNEKELSECRGNISHLNDRMAWLQAEPVTYRRPGAPT